MINYQVEVKDAVELPTVDNVQQIITVTLKSIQQTAADLVVRVVDEVEMKDLNARFRGRDSVTNVLAFPFASPAGIDSSYIGDIVICLPVLKTESKQQQISVFRHFSHMVVHGTLHLFGFDHQTDEQAEVMESLERSILARLGWQ